MKVTIRDEKGVQNEYEIDSQWSQEAELLSERIAAVVKTFIEEMSGQADSTKSLEIIERLSAVEID